MSNRFGFFGRYVAGGETANAIVAEFAVDYTIANANSVIFSVTSNLTNQQTMRYTITGVNSTAFIDNTLTDTFNLDINGNATIIKSIDPVSTSDSGTFYLQVQRVDGLETFATTSNITILTVASVTQITGGVQGTNGSNTSITINSNTTLSITKASDPWITTDTTPIYIEMVGGGGGGQYKGGHGGNLIITTTLANTISAGNAIATVGSGGLGGPSATAGTNSSIFGLTALGGPTQYQFWYRADTNQSDVYGGEGGNSRNGTGAAPVFNAPLFPDIDGSFIVTGGTGKIGNSSVISGREYGGGGGGGSYIFHGQWPDGNVPWANYRGVASEGGGFGGLDGVNGTGGGGGGGYAPHVGAVGAPALTYGNGGSGSIYIELPIATTYNVLSP